MDHRDGRRRVGWDNFTRVILLLLAFTFHIGVYLLDFPATFLFATSESWLVSHVHLFEDIVPSQNLGRTTPYKSRPLLGVLICSQSLTYHM